MEHGKYKRSIRRPRAALPTSEAAGLAPRPQQPRPPVPEAQGDSPRRGARARRTARGAGRQPMPAAEHARAPHDRTRAARPHVGVPGGRRSPLSHPRRRRVRRAEAGPYSGVACRWRGTKGGGGVGVDPLYTEVGEGRAGVDPTDKHGAGAEAAPRVRVGRSSREEASRASTGWPPPISLAGSGGEDPGGCHAANGLAREE